MKTEEEIQRVINFYKSRKTELYIDALIFTQIITTLEWVLEE